MTAGQTARRARIALPWIALAMGGCRAIAPTASAPASRCEVALTTAPDSRPVRLRLPLPPRQTRPIRDTFREQRSGDRIHEASDLFAPVGTPITPRHAGWIVSMARNALGGLTISVLDSTEHFVSYYAHLQARHPARTLLEWVDAGTVLGWVGQTGNAAGTPPHLHYQIRELQSGESWRAGTPRNPAIPLQLSARCLMDSDQAR